MKLEQAGSSTVPELWAVVQPQVESAQNLEAAAQSLAQALYLQFSESVKLVRFFATVPFSDLPATNQQFVQKLINQGGADKTLQPTTPVLSLLGSSGELPEWNDRRQSKDHVGIPLLSKRYLRAIPMISRLLAELGVPGEWMDAHDSELIINTIGSAAGLFYVEDAASAVNADGRNIISPQFVSEYDIHSVFGTGGAYSTGQFGLFVVFGSGHVPRTVAQRFLPLAALFVSRTNNLVEERRIFDA